MAFGLCHTLLQMLLLLEVRHTLFVVSASCKSHATAVVYQCQENGFPNRTGCLDFHTGVAAAHLAGLDCWVHTRL